MVKPDFTKPNPEFDLWKATLPSTHWAKYDLSACRLGWEAALAFKSPEIDEWRSTAFRCEAIFPLMTRLVSRVIDVRPDLKDEMMGRIEAMEKLFERASFIKLRAIHGRFEHLDSVFRLVEGAEDPFRAAARDLWIVIDDLMRRVVLPPAAVSGES